MEKSRKEMLRMGYDIRPNMWLLVVPLGMWIGYFSMLGVTREMGDQVFTAYVIYRTATIVTTIYFGLKCGFSKTIISGEYITLINFLNIMKAIPIRLITSVEIKTMLFSEGQDRKYFTVYSGNEKIFSLSESHPEYGMVLSILKSKGIKVIEF